MERTGAFRRVLNEPLNVICSLIKNGAQKCLFRSVFEVEKWGENGVGGTVGGTNGWTIRASIDPFNGKNQGKNHKIRAETTPLIPFNT